MSLCLDFSLGRGYHYAEKGSDLDMKQKKSLARRLIAAVLALCLLASLGSALAIDAGQTRAVIGANLTQEQKNVVYNTFGITPGSVTELTVTNSEERTYLESYVDSSIIGNNAISCVYLETLEEGSGLQVSCSNITWCTQEMYVNALVTAGVSDAKLIVTAPFGVSGTAALTGVYKAYEDITGEKLDELAKLAGTQELVITAELADTIGNIDAVTIVNELKGILDETQNMTDEQLRQQILAIAEQYNVSLSDTLMNQLVKLCRSLEGLSNDELQAKVEQVQGMLSKLAGAKETVSGIVSHVKNFFAAIGDFFSNLFGK